MEKALPVISGNSAYIEGKKRRASLFLPNPYIGFISFTVSSVGFLMMSVVFLQGFMLSFELKSHGKQVNGVVDAVKVRSKGC